MMRVSPLVLQHLAEEGLGVHDGDGNQTRVLTSLTEFAALPVVEAVLGVLVSANMRKGKGPSPARVEMRRALLWTKKGAEMWAVIGVHFVKWCRHTNVQNLPGLDPVSILTRSGLSPLVLERIVMVALIEIGKLPSSQRPDFGIPPNGDRCR
jgi:hypothetical protein